MTATSLGFLGVRTGNFDEMVHLYRDVMGLEQVHDGPDAAWFRLDDGTQIHVYGPGDVDHEFFGETAVVGIRVDDFDQVRAEMLDAGVEFLGEPQRDGVHAWNHYRGPDGNIYEIIGPDASN